MKGELVAGVAVALVVILPAYAGTFSGGSPFDEGIAPRTEGPAIDDPVPLGGEDQDEVVPVPSTPTVHPGVPGDPAVPLRCTPSSAGDADTTLLPEALGSIRLLPEMGIFEPAPVGTTVQSNYFRTTAENREFRRGFIEFDLPWESVSAASATLVLTETRGWTSTPLPPDPHELAYYVADGAVTTEDYDRPAVRCATFETDNNEPTAVFAFDITPLVHRYAGLRLGFRVKLAADPEIFHMGFAGSQFGERYAAPPEIRLA